MLLRDGGLHPLRVRTCTRRPAGHWLPLLHYLNVPVCFGHGVSRSLARCTTPCSLHPLLAAALARCSSRSLQLSLSAAGSGHLAFLPCSRAPIAHPPLPLPLERRIFSSFLPHLLAPHLPAHRWNVFCLYLIFALFHFHSLSFGRVLALATAHPPLFAFLLVALLAIPIYGQIHPKRVPFLAAYRPYAGNWRKTWHIVDAAATDKLRNLKTLEGPFVSENATMLWGSSPAVCEQLEEYFIGNMVRAPRDDSPAARVPRDDSPAALALLLSPCLYTLPIPLPPHPAASPRLPLVCSGLLSAFPADRPHHRKAQGGALLGESPRLHPPLQRVLHQCRLRMVAWHG